MDANLSYVPISRGFKTFFERLEREVKRAYDDTVRIELRAAAVTFRTDLVTSVQQGRYQLAPLSPRWAAKKKKHKLDPRILIASEESLRQIRITDLPPSTGMRGFMVAPTKDRVKPYKFQKKSPTITYDRLWEAHELGKGNLPVRPVWAMTGARTMAKAPQIERRIERAFGRRLRRRISRMMA